MDFGNTDIKEPFLEFVEPIGETEHADLFDLNDVSDSDDDNHGRPREREYETPVLNFGPNIEPNIEPKDEDEDKPKPKPKPKSNPESNPEPEEDNEREYMTGVEFNLKYPGKKYKWTTASNTNRGYKYKEGLNILKEEFNTKPECGPGGLFFALEEHYMLWGEYGNYLNVNLWEAEIPHDAKVVMVGTKAKSDKLIIKNRKIAYSKDQFTITVKDDTPEVKSIRSLPPVPKPMPKPSPGGGSKEDDEEEPRPDQCMPCSILSIGPDIDIDSILTTKHAEQIVEMNARYIDILPERLKTPELYVKVLKKVPQLVTTVNIDMLIEIMKIIFTNSTGDLHENTFALFGCCIKKNIGDTITAQLLTNDYVNVIKHELVNKNPKLMWIALLAHLDEIQSPHYNHNLDFEVDWEVFGEDRVDVLHFFSKKASDILDHLKEGDRGYEEYQNVLKEEKKKSRQNIFKHRPLRVIDAKKEDLSDEICEYVVRKIGYIIFFLPKEFVTYKLIQIAHYESEFPLNRKVSYKEIMKYHKLVTEGDRDPPRDRIEHYYLREDKPFYKWIRDKRNQNQITNLEYMIFLTDLGSSFSGGSIRDVPVDRVTSEMALFVTKHGSFYVESEYFPPHAYTYELCEELLLIEEYSILGLPLKYIDQSIIDFVKDSNAWEELVDMFGSEDPEKIKEYLRKDRERHPGYDPQYNLEHYREWEKEQIIRMENKEKDMASSLTHYQRVELKTLKNKEKYWIGQAHWTNSTSENCYSSVENMSVYVDCH